MKLSSNSIGILIFILLAVTVFFFMAKRPAVDGIALNFGMPIQSQTSSNSNAVEETAAKVEEATSKPVEAEEAKSEEVTTIEEVETKTTESVESNESVKEEEKQEAVEPTMSEDASSSSTTEAPKAE